MVFNPVKAPNTYAPLSPRKIFALGKLNNKKDKRIIIWEINKTENSKFSLFKLISWSLVY